MPAVEHNIIIVGSGPAGASTALHLARLVPELARRALVLERARHPRPKLCAGGILQDGERILRRLGLDLARFPHVDVHVSYFTFEGRGFGIRRQPAVFRVIRRDAFDAWLVDAVRAAGVVVQEGVHVWDVRRVGNAIELETSSGTYRARAVVGADGVQSVVRRAVLPRWWRLGFLWRWYTERFLIDWTANKAPPEVRGEESQNVSLFGTGQTGLQEAILDFQRARSRAKLEQILARLSGGSAELLRYEEVRKKLGAIGEIPRGLQNIRIDAIVGSVGRYDDFTRRFLPRRDDDERRWARVKMAMADMSGVPPIEVYQIGQAYFVLDGNHRVSVARQFGAAYIQAYVTEVQTNVPLSPDVQPDDLILKAEYAAFLEHTHLDRLRPQADLSVSVPGQYRELEEHIAVHHYFMGLDQQRDVAYKEAVVHWYDTVYLPVVQVIREQGILRDFPDRTETDLYLWILEHRAELGKELHWQIRPEVVAGDLVDRFSPRLDRVVARMGSRVLRAVLPEAIAPGPSPGEWRQKRGWPQGGTEELVQGAACRTDRLFANVLVAVSGGEGRWGAVEQALRVARREEGQLVGLHVVSSDSEKESDALRATQVEFDRRCAEAGVPGRLIVDAGSVAPKICEWSRWIDLTVVDLAHPPGDQPVARLSSGFRALIQRCPSPILAVPQVSSGMDRVLLAYDGSSKADEALFVSTYLVCRWDVQLVVVTVVEGDAANPQTLGRAQRYLEGHGVQATFVEERGSVGEAILRTAEAQQSELLIMGGYGFDPVLEIVLGSAVDQVLRASRQPVLICR